MPAVASQVVRDLDVEDAVEAKTSTIGEPYQDTHLAALAKAAQLLEESSFSNDYDNPGATNVSLGSCSTGTPSLVSDQMTQGEQTDGAPTPKRGDMNSTKASNLLPKAIALLQASRQSRTSKDIKLNPSLNTFQSEPEPIRATTVSASIDLEEAEYVAQRSAAVDGHTERRNSLPSLIRNVDGTYSLPGASSPTRSLMDPFIRPDVSFGPRQSSSRDSTGPQAVASTPEAEPQQHSKRSIFARAQEQLIATYAPRIPPALVLPSGPTDEEKLCYLKSNRLGLYTFGVFSFLSLSAGMWLFVVSAIPFYWFGAMVVLLELYLFVSYGVSIVGKDFDHEGHLKILQDHPIDNETAPTVDVYLPCCKEPMEVLENTYKYVKALKYPADKLKVWVLDDGASPEVEALAASYGYNYMCRDDRPRLKKAGNLRWAFARTTGDYFAIYDADFCPREDFLLELIPQHLAHPKTAIVQTPQFFRVKDEQTWVEQGAGGVQELFYRIIEVNRNRWGASICVGSNALYRREALVEVGGTAEIGFSEDVHTGFYALTRGWELRYVPIVLACGICPDTPRAFFSQQMRWCMGSTTLLTNPDFWRSNLTFMQKLCYLSGMMYYSAISLSIFLNPIPGILMVWVRPDYVRYYNLAFAVPSLIYSVIAVRCWTKARYGFNVQFIMVIQSFAYLTAIKDRLFGRALAWVPSGDTKAHKNTKYRNMRILACVWIPSAAAALIAGVTYQCLRGMHWYDALPSLLLMVFNFYLGHRFMFCHGKL